MASAAEIQIDEGGLSFSRCVVARGRSRCVEMRFEGPDPRTCQVGAAPDCGWWIEGRDTPPYAFDLHWDGQLLWIADRAETGQVTVDGERVGRRWRGLGGTCRIGLPGAALVVDCSRPGVIVEDVPRGLPAEPVPIMSEVREVLRPPEGADVATLDDASLMDEPTRSWPGPGAMMGPHGRGTLPGTGIPRPSRQALVPPPNPAAVPDGTLPGVGQLRHSPPVLDDSRSRAPGRRAANGRSVDPAPEGDRVTPVLEDPQS